MITELYEPNQISLTEAMLLSIERMSIEIGPGMDENTPIDVINYFENRIDFMKTDPNSVGIEHYERSLEILRAVEARSKVSFPQKI